MSLSRKFKRRSQLEERVFDALVKNQAIKIAKQAVYSADKRMKDWEKQSCIDSAMVFVGALAAIAVDENWSKLAPKATRIKVFAEVLKEALESTNEITAFNELTDKQKKTAEIIAKTLGLPWRLGDGKED